MKLFFEEKALSLSFASDKEKEGMDLSMNKTIRQAIMNDVTVIELSKNAMTISLDASVLKMLGDWHAGQFSKTYALLSTGMYRKVSIAMIQNAIDELEKVFNGLEESHLVISLSDLLLELKLILIDNNYYPVVYNTKQVS